MKSLIKLVFMVSVVLGIFIASTNTTNASGMIYIDSANGISTYMVDNDYKHNNEYYSFSLVSNDSTKNAFTIIRITANTDTCTYVGTDAIVIKNGCKYHVKPVYEAHHYTSNSVIQRAINIIDKLEGDT